MILNEDNQPITDPDLSTGRLISEEMPVEYAWSIDEPAETERVVVREYPNGGKDFKTVEVKAEEGHWEVTHDGEPVPHFDWAIPDTLPHDRPNPDVWTFQRYVPYTAEELAEVQAQRAEQEAAEAKAAEREEMLEGLPDTLASTDEAICALYEMMLEVSNG